MAEQSDRIHKALIAANCLYMICGIVLICMSALAMRATALFTLPIVGGLAATGTFLLVLAVLGIVGVVMGNQALIFFYLVFMFIVYFIQFCIAVACLAAFGKDHRMELFLNGWEESSNVTRQQVQIRFNCCGLDQKHVNYTSCEETMLPCCTDSHNCTGCSFCKHPLDHWIRQVIHCTGGMGIFFSFLQLGGVFLAWWYRRQPTLGFGHDILN